MSTDPANSCALFITVHSHTGRPALSARFQFEDHIRCVAARQCLQRNRENLRLAKMTRVAKLLHLPLPEQNAENVTLSLPQSSVGSVAHLSGASPSDLSRSGLHQAFQDPLTTEPSSQDFEMDQLHPQSSHTLEKTREKATE